MGAMVRNSPCLDVRAIINSLLLFGGGCISSGCMLVCNVYCWDFSFYFLLEYPYVFQKEWMLYFIIYNERACTLINRES